MSVTVMRKKFDMPPNKDEILGLVTGNKGDKGKAKDALLSILSPMKDLLALLEYVETMDATAKQYADLLKEQDAAKKSIDVLKAKTAKVEEDYEAAKIMLNGLLTEVANLEKSRNEITSEIISAEQAKLRVNKVVSDEYDRLRDEMLKRVAADEKKAREGFATLQGAIANAQSELESLQEKKRQFIASLTA